MNHLHHNPYLLDILSQPAALRQALDQADMSQLDWLAQAIAAGQFDRIVLTGMGASYYGMYPAWLHLASAGLPAIWVDAAELVHHASGLITARTLLWIASQSGHSAEVLSLLRLCEKRPPLGLLALTNDLDSPLAQATENPGSIKQCVRMPLLAEPENTPSTRTYLHTLALGQLAALYLSQADLSPHRAALQLTASGIAAYLDNWQGHLREAGELVERAASPVPSIALVGRGLSYTTAMAGALNLQESAKMPALGLQAAEFRHGPLEMAAPGLTVLVFAGQQVQGGSVWEMNERLWKELGEMGVNAWFMDHPTSPASFSTEERGEAWNEGHRVLEIPEAIGIGLPLAEIIPIQLLCLYLSQRAGITPGTFRHIGKVTVIE